MRSPVVFREAFGVRTRPRVAFDCSICDGPAVISGNTSSIPTIGRVAEEI